MEEKFLRKNFLKIIGEFPGKVKLSYKILEKIDCGDYLREKIILQQDKEEKIPTYILIPKNISPPLPAIVAIHQHGGQFHLGKSEPAGISGSPDSFYGLELCRRGYFVIIPDQLCFEERRPDEEERKKSGYLQDGSYEKFVFLKYLLNGATLQARYLFDLSTVVDYLLIRKEVNKNKIGAIGHSLGGQQTLFLLFYDKRVKAGVSNCGVGMWESIIRDNVSHNFAAYLPGMLKIGDMDKFLSCIVPKPMMIIAGEKDLIFPVDGVRKIGKYLKKKYKEKNTDNNFEVVIHSEGHCFTKEMRECAYNFLDKHLK